MTRKEEGKEAAKTDETCGVEIEMSRSLAFQIFKISFMCAHNKGHFPLLITMLRLLSFLFVPLLMWVVAG